MINKLSNRIGRIKDSPSVKAQEIISKLKDSGKEIVNFSIGEPDFDTPDAIKLAGIDAILNDKSHYTNSRGVVELREEISKSIYKKHNINYSNDEIIVGCGAKQIIFSAFASTLNNDDEVIIPSPYWVSYPDLVSLFGGKSIILKGDENNKYKITANELDKKITTKTKWLILNSPNNPSGHIYTKKELLEICNVLKKHKHVLILSDEIYEDFNYVDKKTVSIASLDKEIKERVLVINGVSKSHAMTGWRIGYGAGNKILINAINKLISQSTTCPSAISQHAAIHALKSTDNEVIVFSEKYRKRGETMANLLNDIEGIQSLPPQGAFYLYPSVKGLIGKKTQKGDILKTDKDIALYLLEDAGVAVLDGEAYGMSPNIRVSFATSEENIVKGCTLIKESINKLS